MILREGEEMNLNAVGQLAYCILHSLAMFKGWEKHFYQEELPSEIEAALHILKVEVDKLQKVYEEERIALLLSPWNSTKEKEKK